MGNGSCSSCRQDKEIDMTTRNSDSKIKQSASQSRQSGDAQGSKRGFAAMDRQLQREIASRGGQAAHQRGTAHEFDSEEARLAGQKGGVMVSRDREHMAQIGRRGGESRQAAQREDDRSSASRSAPDQKKTGRPAIKRGNR
jgi:general stress protein YciG